MTNAFPRTCCTRMLNNNLLNRNVSRSQACSLAYDTWVAVLPKATIMTQSRPSREVYASNPKHHSPQEWSDPSKTAGRATARRASERPP